MALNPNMFYENMVTPDEVNNLARILPDVAALAQTVCKLSGGVLKVSKITLNIDTANALVPTGNCFIVSPQGFPTCKVGNDEGNNAEYYARSLCDVNLKKRGKDKRVLTSLKQDRIGRILKKNKFVDRMCKESGHNITTYASSLSFTQYKNELTKNLSSSYPTHLSGLDMCELLKVVYGKPINEIPDAVRNSAQIAHERYTVYEMGINNANKEMEEAFGRETLAVCWMKHGLAIGTIKINIKAARDVTEIIPLKLYKDINSIPDEKLRDDLMFSLVACRTNREQNNTETEYRDADRLIPAGDHTFLESQSAAVAVITAMVQSLSAPT